MSPTTKRPCRCRLRGGRGRGHGFLAGLLLMMTMIATKAATTLDASTAAQLDALFAEFDHPNAPGASVMVIHHGKPVFAKGYGLANLETKTPCTTNTNFRLASVTKQFTAMAVLMLAERKQLSLNETLPAFFPEFPAYGRGITVRHLLTHTSGLIDYEDEIPTGTTLPVLDRDVLRILMKQEKTYFAPGAQYRYSNSGYALLAMMVEARSGQAFARFLKDNLFTPLKMTNTLAYEAGLSSVSNRAYGHSRRTNVWHRTDQSLTSSVLGDGGVYSSTTDLFKWDQALYKSKLVSAERLKQAFTPHTATDRPGRSYGFGWYVGEHRGCLQIWHSGETIGFRTRLARFPEQKFTVILLANRTDVKLDGLPEKCFDLLFPAK